MLSRLDRAAMSTAFLVLMVAGPSFAVSAPAAASADPCRESDISCDEAGYDVSAGSSVVTVVQDFGAASPATRSVQVPGPPPVCFEAPAGAASAYDVRAPGEPDAGYLAGQGFQYLQPTELFPALMPGWYPVGHLDALTREASGDTGRYYGPTCSFEDSGLSAPGMVQRHDSFLAAAVPQLRYVAAGAQPPPAADLTVEQLLDVVRDRIEPPEPDPAQNPDAFTLVNLPTWVWTDPATFTAGTVRATSGATWVQVDVVPAGMALAAPPAAQARTDGDCADGGWVWGAGVPESAATCTITLGRVPPGAVGTWPVEVTTSWEATWTSSDGTSGDLPGRSTATMLEVEVREVQSLVTRVG